MTAEENSAAGESCVAVVALTEEQKQFLAECETEFADRYTENDQEFIQYKEKSCTPPIVDPWHNNKPRRNYDWSSRGSPGGRRHQNYNRNDRGYNQYGGSGGYHRQSDRYYHNRYRPY